MALAASRASGAPAANLCERVEWTGPHEGLGPYGDRFGAVQRSYQRSDGLTAIKADLPQVYKDMESADPVARRDAVTRLRTMREWFQWRAKELDPEAVERLKRLLDRETNVQVVDEAIRALGAPKAFSKEVVPYIVQILRCPAAGASKQEALQVAQYDLDTAIVEPLLDLWKAGESVPNRDLVLATLAKLKDPRAAPMALDALGQGLANASLLLRAVGTRDMLPVAIAAYRRASHRYGGVVSFAQAVAEIGGPDAMAYLKEEFERVTASEKGDIADMVLQAQLEPGKPEWTEEDRRGCVPFEDIQARQLPYLRKEVPRLLDERNRPYFEANAWRRSTALADLVEWGRALDPEARVTHLRRVLDLVGDGPSGKPARNACSQDLLWALAGRASARTTTDPAGAAKDLDEAESIASTLPGWNGGSRLKMMRDRLARLRQPDDPGTRLEGKDLVGTFTRGGGFGTSTLTLKGDGTFACVNTSDAIEHCRPGGSTMEGRYLLERDYLILTPGPLMRGFGIVGSDAFLPVPWGKRMYLLDELQVPEFCQVVNAGKLGPPSRLVSSYYYVRAETDEPPSGQPKLPAKWKGWLLPEPVIAKVTRLASDNGIVIDAGEEKGIRVGTQLFAADDTQGAQRTWRIVEVEPDRSLGRPLGATQRAPEVGMRVTTRASLPPDDGSLKSLLGKVRQDSPIIAAKVHKTVKPVVPDAAARAGVSGNVVVEVLVDEHGRVEVKGIRRGLGHGLDEAAAEAVRQYEFEPATQDGRPIPSTMNIPVAFTRGEQAPLP